MGFPNTCRLVVEALKVDEQTHAEEFMAGLWAGRRRVCGRWPIGDGAALYDLAKKTSLNAHIHNPRIDGQGFPLYEMHLYTWLTQFHGKWKRAIYPKYGHDILGVWHDVLRSGLGYPRARNGAYRTPDELVYGQIALWYRQAPTCRLVLLDGGKGAAHRGQSYSGEVRSGRKRLARWNLGNRDDVLQIAHQIPLTAVVKLTSASGKERWRETPLRLVKYRDGQEGLKTPHGADILIRGFVESVGVPAAAHGPFVRPAAPICTFFSG